MPLRSPPESAPFLHSPKNSLLLRSTFTELGTGLRSPLALSPMGTPFPERHPFPRPLLNICPASWADGHPFSRPVCPPCTPHGFRLCQNPDPNPSLSFFYCSLTGEPFSLVTNPSHGAELTPAPGFSGDKEDFEGCEGWPSLGGSGAPPPRQAFLHWRPALGCL